MQVTNDVKRVPLVADNPSFADVTNVVCKPVEDKAPKWWLIGLMLSFSLLLMMVGMIGYLVWDGVGVWGLNQPVGWGFAATDIGRDIVSPSEDRPKGTLGTVADTYSDLVDTTTNMDFSRNVKSQNLQPSTRGNVTVMDPIKVSDMVNNQGTADTNTDSSSEDSIPLVGAEDISNSYIPFTKDLLGVYD